MAGLKQVRFLRPHKRWKPGDTAEFQLGVADTLVRVNKAEWVTGADAPVLETATAEPGAEQQVVKRKRGRPRKNPVATHG
jgi:hypothetical protein